MRSNCLGESLRRNSRLEKLEERLALSAQPAGDFFLSEFLVAQSQLQHVEVAPALADVHGASGVNHAQQAYGFTGQGQTVAVIDTGIAYDHFALGAGFGSGYRVVGGWDFAENDANPYDDGPAGFHGTHVAGIVGSDDQTYSGVAPGVDLVALRVFDDRGAGYFSWVEDALQWVHDNRNAFENPITTVNLSLGTSWNSDSVPNWAMLEDEFALLEADGIFISVAAGNSFAKYNSPGLSYPAVSPYVVPVASHNNSGAMSGFSQRNERVIVAPGQSITSTVPDYIFGADGVPNDFGTASGTSMASPYVAGASVLLREAMQFARMENITQDAIYDHFRNTADLIYDSATNAYYHQLNLQRALDTLLPDDYGSSSANAFAWGTLSGGESITGMIARLDDRDFFRFTAGQSGTMTFTASVTDDMAAKWGLAGAGGTVNGNLLTFDVVAGQSYTISLASSKGIGHYTISANLENAEIDPVDWGTIASVRFNNETVSGENWYQFTASRSGRLTVQALFKHAGGNVDMELFDSEGKLLKTRNSLNNNERIDVSASAGKTYLLRVHGQNDDVDFRLTNLLRVRKGQVEVDGTEGNDRYKLVGKETRYKVIVNGTHYNFRRAAIKSFKFNGGEGRNQIVMDGDLEDATVRLQKVRHVLTVAQRAEKLDRDLGLHTTGNYYENWGGAGEKWLRSESGDWYFIKPDGSLYRWSGSSDLSSSQRVARLNAKYHADPSKLHEAADQNADSGAAIGDNNSGSAATTAEQLAYKLDQEHGLYSSGSYYENWGGWGEKWMQSSSGQWFFIKPNGSVYRWGQSRDLSTSELLAELNDSYYADPSKLHDAPPPNSATKAQSLAVSNSPNGPSDQIGFADERFGTNSAARKLASSDTHQRRDALAFIAAAETGGFRHTAFASTSLVVTPADGTSDMRYSADPSGVNSVVMRGQTDGYGAGHVVFHRLGVLASAETDDSLAVHTGETDDAHIYGFESETVSRRDRSDNSSDDVRAVDKLFSHFGRPI